MKQVYYPYWEWEDYHSGMWDKARGGEEELLRQAIEFTGSHCLYGIWMRAVIKLWPKSCEHNLTDLGQNRCAWLGHAAVSLAIGIPEYITRSAWGYLSKDQQDKANRQAELAIIQWEQTTGRGDRRNAQMLFEY